MTAFHPPYRGRFAPTPSGPLHLGSLLTAVLSYLDARAADGQWLLRIDDLDPQRCTAEHSERILRQLEAHGLGWDGTPYHQSAALGDYAAAVEALDEAGVVYGCDCPRKRLRAVSPAGRWGPVYDGRCRDRGLRENDGIAQHALRLRVPSGPVALPDDWRGTLRGDWQRDVGDCVLRRRDGIYGYALASAVDEDRMGITHIVRGADLLAPTLAHFAVLDALGRPRPRSRHGPLLQRADGAKLSKQNHAAPIDEREASRSLLRCCAWLGVRPDGAAPADTPERILREATALWRQRDQAMVMPPAIVVQDIDDEADSRATVSTAL